MDWAIQGMSGRDRDFGVDSDRLILVHRAVRTNRLWSSLGMWAPVHGEEWGGDVFLEASM